MKIFNATRRSEYEAALARVLDSGQFILGPEVAAFEKEWAECVGACEAVGVASGTDAIALALRAVGVERGDRVVTVSHTATATVAAVEIIGAIPVLVDIDDSFTMDPQKLSATLKDTKAAAIVPVHLYGRPAVMDVIASHGIPVVEDAAQAHGASISPRGVAAAYSFYPTKNLGALGDAGAVTTDDAAVADRVRALRQYGWKNRYVSETPGVNSRLDEIQAAILRVGITHLARDNARRREIAGIYHRRLSSSVRCPEISEGHVYHQFVIRTPKRDEILRTCRVPLAVHYPVPVHLQPAYRGRVAVGAGGLEETERIAGEILSIPISPFMTDDEVDGVCEAVLHVL